MSQIVKIENADFYYSSEDVTAEPVMGLNDISLEIGAHEAVLLCGASGSGKSTVLRLMNGLIPHFHTGKLTGSVTVAGLDVAQSELYELGQNVSTVFQNPRTQFFTTDTTSEMAFGAENAGVPPEIIWDRIAKATNFMSTEDLLDLNIFRLSGGEKQLVACTSAMVNEPQLYLFDEPTSNLSPRAIQRFREVLAKLHEAGKPLVIAEHRLYYLRGIIDRVVLIDAGQIKDIIPAKDFWKMEDNQRRALGLRRLEEPKKPEPNLVIHPAGKPGVQKSAEAEADPDPANVDPAEADPAEADPAEAGLALQNIVAGYKRQQPILNFSDLLLPRGKVIALVGDNGAGKSTLAAVICGLMKSKGELKLGDQNLSAKKRTNLSFEVMQDVHRQLFTASVEEEIVLGQPKKAADLQKDRQILQDMGLHELLERHPMSLSGGQKQRLTVAVAKASNKQILIFDEPTSGLDLAHLEAVARVLRELADQGKVVVVITHDGELLDSCADLVIKLEKLQN